MTEKPKIESREVTLYMVVEEAREDISSEHEVKVIVPLTMSVVEVLDIFVRTLSERYSKNFLMDTKGEVMDPNDY